MRSKAELATRAVREAARLRARLGVGATLSACPFDAAMELGVVVWLHALPSLEGMYSPGPKPAVVLSTDRPKGRIRHTCAHELGHHVFGHGTSVDELSRGGRRAWKPEEFVADRFATALLMPKLAVAAAIRRRGWNAAKLSPKQAFVVAQDFGVGYASFISHLERTLKMVDPQAAEGLRRSGRELGSLRNAVAGFEVDRDVFVGDEHWGARPIDVEVGDIVVVPPDSLFSGRCVRVACDPVSHLRGVAAGEGQLKLRTRKRAIAVRVSRAGFTGLARYRHMGEPDDE